MKKQNRIYPKEKIRNYLKKVKVTTITNLYRETRVNYYSLKKYINELEKEKLIKVDVIEDNDEYGNKRTQSITIRWLK